MALALKDATPAAPETIYLKDYTPFPFTVESVHLTFRLEPRATRVISRIAFAPKGHGATLELHGEELDLKWARIDGQEVTPDVTDKGLSVAAPDQPFIWEAEVEISPETNTALEGLYMSNGMYCTQCEAEGFRKITFYPDRPDVMSVFTVRIESDLPVLLSNGNKGEVAAGFAEWHDPWPKPAYLFALVAGELVNHPDRFTTASGRDVELNIWVRDGDLHKCGFGMEALKASMRWDEEVYGREYDLDIFNIVAVDDFNMGAMENKGLNIFNSSCVLASPDTSTDANYERIEAIIAHEYFHNWTGNRITCRDWFQLCLKEGLTVFRDAQFTSDMRSAAVKRIDDAMELRGRQFPEDNGPLSHPVRPESFQEINNFYTATVYEKGAEVIAMLKRLVGDAAYYKALELYFTRHDGQACTIEDWIAVFEESTGRDLSQFKLWYSQSGTPRLSVAETFAEGTYTLTFTQETKPTPGQDKKDPKVIPIAVGLLSPNGDEVVPTTLLEMTEATQSFTFEGLGAKPVPSILRDFSAPVILERDVSPAENAFLLAHDTDPFARWDAGRSLMRDVLMSMARGESTEDGPLIEGIVTVLTDRSLDPSFRVQVMSLPGESELAAALFEAGHTPDPDAIHGACETLRQRLAERMQDELPRLYAENQVSGPFSPDAKSAGKREMANAALGLTTRLDGGALAARQFADADNMTLQIAALSRLVQIGKGEAQLAAFYEQWQDDRLVIDKWFGLQVGMAAPERAVDVARALTAHKDFTMTNPNRFRATLGTFGGHHAGFHRADGSGYHFLADWLIQLDAKNPQTTARMCTLFQTWRRYDATRQGEARAALERIAGTSGLSRDTNEMVTRILGD
ncbi:aminopeptidase N [Primorskyibacter sp. S187A]|uniref:aminopeptidase N n=1 Tax=Primorskyibacter sp. S187A TaxID=3415130 RepID=UPI003C7AD025